MRLQTPLQWIRGNANDADASALARALFDVCEVLYWVVALTFAFCVAVIAIVGITLELT